MSTTHAGHVHGPLTNDTKVVVEVCTDCRATIGDRLGLPMQTGPDVGSFGAPMCPGCFKGLADEGRTEGLEPVLPGDKQWFACTHIAQRRREQMDADDADTEDSPEDREAMAAGAEMLADAMDKAGAKTLGELFEMQRNAKPDA